MLSAQAEDSVSADVFATCVLLDAAHNTTMPEVDGTYTSPILFTPDKIAACIADSSHNEYSTRQGGNSAHDAQTVAPQTRTHWVCNKVWGHTV